MIIFENIGKGKIKIKYNYVLLQPNNQKSL